MHYNQHNKLHILYFMTFFEIWKLFFSNIAPLGIFAIFHVKKENFEFWTNWNDIPTPLSRAGWENPALGLTIPPAASPWAGLWALGRYFTILPSKGWRNTPILPGQNCVNYVWIHRRHSGFPHECWTKWNQFRTSGEAMSAELVSFCPAQVGKCTIPPPNPYGTVIPV